jgi:hypothetical protein
MWVLIIVLMAAGRTGGVTSQRVEGFVLAEMCEREASRLVKEHPGNVHSAFCVRKR